MSAPNVTLNEQRSSAHDFEGDERLIEVWRGEHVESVHRGSIAAVDSTGALIARVGDITQPVFLRSGAKPFQVMPAILAGGIEQFGITEPELSVMCSSHTGEPRHVEAVQSVLAKIGLDESALQCGIHPPLGVDAAAERWRTGLEPTPVCNNCSGVHAGMLMACRAEGWPVQDYGDPSHPLQRRIREVVAEFAGVAAVDPQEATDTCAVPTLRLPLYRTGLMFARLASGRGVADSLAQVASLVRAAMTAYPEMVGGEHRLDSDVMHTAAGKLVTKGGAEGFQGVGVVQGDLGLALKISDGGERAAVVSTMHVLHEMQLLGPAALGALDQYRAPRVTTLRGQIAGRVVPTFTLRWLR